MRQIILFVMFFSFVHSQLKLKLTQVFEIGFNNNASPEYFFKYPYKARVDKDGNLYLYDYGRREIKKFSSNGKFIKSYGRFGSGPGEFKHIKVMEVDSKNNLLVFDVILQRLTVFDENPIPKIFKSNVNCFLNPEEFYQNSDSTYIVYDPNKASSTEKYFNEYNLSWEKLYSEFGDKNFFFSESDPNYLFLENGNRLNFVVLNNNSIWVTPKYFSGKHFLFKRINEKWKGEIVISRKLKYDSLTKISKDEYSNTVLKNKIASAGRNFKLFAIINNQSLGLIKYKNEKILNFCYQRISKRNYVFGVEIFNLVGEYLGFSTIENLSQAELTKKYFNVIGSNNKDIIYCTVFSDGIYGLKAYSIEIINK